MERYEFQFNVGKEFTRLVLTNRTSELCTLAESFDPYRREAECLILSYLGAESLDERIDEALSRAGTRPLYPLVIPSGSGTSRLPKCPTGAIHLSRDGRVQIYQSSCISCGQCTKEGFSAYARTGLYRSLEILKSGKKVTALIAPSVIGQFGSSFEKLENALESIGFSKVVNVMTGARMMAQTEGYELENCIKCSNWMITSCCASINELSHKLLPVLKEYHSSARTPVEYTSSLLKAEDPESLVIFIGPCLAKILECSRNECVDSVLLFSELEMIFGALGVDPGKEDPGTDMEEMSGLSRSSGISRAVKSFCSLPSTSVCYSGISPADLTLFSSWAKGERPDADLVEIVCCPGGCIAGPGNTTRIRKSS